MLYNEMKDKVSFVSFKKTGPYPEDEDKDVELYSSFAKIYNPSIKDLEIMKSTEYVKGLSVIIRDPYRAYEISNKHFIKVSNKYYGNKYFNIIEIRPNTPIDNYITLLLVEKP